MERRQARNQIVVGAMLGATVGVVVSVFREQIAHIPPLVLLDALGLWVFYISRNLLLAGFTSAIYMGLVGYLLSMFLVRGRFSMVWGLLGGLVSLHVILIWRLDVLLAPSIGEGFHLWFSR